MSGGWGIWAAIGVGGAIGAMARHAVNKAALAAFGPAFPWGTLMVNVAGSLCLGVIAALLAAKPGESALLRGFLAVGVLGAFTTFSTFALDAVSLFRERSIWIAAAYAAGSLTCSIFAFVAGWTITRGAS